MDTDAPALHPVLIEISDLALDPRNARTHGARNLDSIAKSLVDFRQRKAIVVNKRTMTVEAGNGTVEAALAAGATKIVAVLVDDDDATAAAFAIADNRTAELAGWDLEQLGATVAEFPDVDWDGLGWGAEDLAEALRAKAVIPDNEPSGDPRQLDVQPPPPPDEHEPEADDPIPDPPPEPITKPGEVVAIGPHVLHCADCMDVLRSLPDNSVDAIVTDPPYGLSPDGRARTWDDIEALRREGKGPKVGFMGNAWDAGVPGITWARECLRVLKPGGHLIAHSATRTVHRLACAVEDAGFEIRDMIEWLYWQAMPKSLDVSKALDDLHGAERKVVGYRAGLVGGGFGDTGHGLGSSADAVPITEPASADAIAWAGWGTMLKPAHEPAVFARKPISEQTVALNVIKWGVGAINIDGSRHFNDGTWPGPWHDGDQPKWPANIYACPKPATSERDAGCEDKWNGGGIGERRRQAGLGMRHNAHPTVKPTKLYRWFLRLVTPPGGTVLETFGGSGTTLVAASLEGIKVIAAEREPQYCDIIRARVEHSLAKQAG